MAVKEKSSKGKEVAGQVGPSKRKSANEPVDSNDSGRRKRSRPGSLKFIDDEAMDAGSEEEELSDSGDDFIERDDEKQSASNVKQSAKTGRTYAIALNVKEEEAYDAELEKYIKKHLAQRSTYVVHEDEWEDTKDLDNRVDLGPTKTDPNLWKVKCMTGKERHLTFCLIQKFRDLSTSKNDLKIISAFALDHLKGYIFIEAERECDAIEACEGFCNIYSSRITLVPKNEAPHLLSVPNKSYEVSIGTWVRLKSGIYKGDLAKVIAVDSERGRVTIKLIPRIDLGAMAQKFGGGATSKPASIPAPRLIRSYQLRDFRAHIESRRDHETGEVFEILDGLMLKDGYLYKKVSLKSLSYWDIQPSSNEIHKFEVAEDGVESLDWLSSVYGGEKQKHHNMLDEMSATPSRSKGRHRFGVLDLILFNQKDFGVIISIEDDFLKVLKVNYEMEEIVSIKIEEIKGQICDKMFTALDKQKTTVSIGDHVRILSGRHEGKKGFVKHMYRGAMFVHDANQSDYCGLFCTKSEFVEKTSTSATCREGTVHATRSLGFEDSINSNPESPKQATQHSNYSSFRSNKQVDDDRFSIGQTLRIRVGPLKGYLCQVMALYRSDAKVKLQSQSKVIKVNYDHLSELKSYGSSFRSMDLPISDSGNPFGECNRQSLTEDGLNNGGTGAFTESNGWDVNEPFAKRDAWNASSSDPLFGSPGAMTFGTGTTTVERTTEGDQANDPWGSKAGPSIQINDRWAKAGVRSSANSWVNNHNQGCDANITTDGWHSASGQCKNKDTLWDTVIADGKGLDGDTDRGTDAWANPNDGGQNATHPNVVQNDNWNRVQCSDDRPSSIDVAEHGYTGTKDNWSMGNNLASGSQMAKWDSDLSTDKDVSGQDCWNAKGTASESDPSSRSIKNLDAENRSEADKDRAWTKNSHTSGSGNSSWGNAIASEVQGAGSQNQRSVWNMDNSWGDGTESSWNKENLSFGEGGGTSYKGNDWSKTKTFGTCGEQSQADGGGISNWDNASAGKIQGAGSQNQKGGWNADNSWGDGKESSWNKGKMSFGEGGGTSYKGNDWSKAKNFGTSCGEQSQADGGGISSWENASTSKIQGAGSQNQKGGWNADNSWGDGKESSWNIGNLSFGEGGRTSYKGNDWSKPKTFGTSCGKQSQSDGGRISSWDAGSVSKVQGAGSQNQKGGWNTDNSWGDGKESAWNKGNLSFGEGGGTSYKGNDWSKPETFSTCGEQSQADGGGWKSNQHDSWNKPNSSFTGGRGSGGRRGRGDVSGRGRFSGHGRAGGWNKDQEGGCNEERGSWRGRGNSFRGGRGGEPGWVRGRGFDGSRNGGRSDSWGRANTDDGDYGSGRDRGQENNPGAKEEDWSGKASSWGNQSSKWNIGGNREGEDAGNANWKGGANQSKEHLGGWNDKKSFGEYKSSADWSKGKESSDWSGSGRDRGQENNPGAKEEDWSGKASSWGNQSSKWNIGGNREGEDAGNANWKGGANQSKEHLGGWNDTKSFGEYKSSADWSKGKESSDWSGSGRDRGQENNPGAKEEDWSGKASSWGNQSSKWNIGGNREGEDAGNANWNEGANQSKEHLGGWNDKKSFGEYKSSADWSKGKESSDWSGSGRDRGQENNPGAKEEDWSGKASSWGNQSSKWNIGGNREGEDASNANWKGGANQSKEHLGGWNDKKSFGEYKLSADWSKGKDSSDWMGDGGSGDRGRGRSGVDWSKGKESSGWMRDGGSGDRGRGRGGRGGGRGGGGRSSGWNNSDKGEGVGVDQWSSRGSQGDKWSFTGNRSCGWNTNDKGTGREWSSSGWSSGGKESDFPGNGSSSNWNNTGQSSGWKADINGGTFGGNPSSGWNSGGDNVGTAGSKWESGSWMQADAPEKTKTGYGGSDQDQATTSRNEAGSTPAEADKSWEARGSGSNSTWGGKSEW